MSCVERAKPLYSAAMHRLTRSDSLRLHTGLPLAGLLLRP
jgi:hypothetical protein